MSLLGTAVALVAAAQTASYYSELLHQYAAGDRAAAVAELSSLEDGQIARELDALRDRANRHCASCDAAALQADLRAAVMLHTDRDELERRPLQISGERAPSCAPPVHALFAERALAPLLDQAAGREFARRWYLAMGLRSLGDICLEEGRQWTSSGLKRFPKDKELLLARGLLAEALATVARLRQPSAAAVTPRELDLLREQQQEGQSALLEAGKAFEQALAADRVLRGGVPPPRPRALPARPAGAGAPGARPDRRREPRPGASLSRLPLRRTRARSSGAHGGGRATPTRTRPASSPTDKRRRWRSLTCA